LEARFVSRKEKTAFNKSWTTDQRTGKKDTFELPSKRSYIPMRFIQQIAPILYVAALKNCRMFF